MPNPSLLDQQSLMELTDVGVDLAQRQKSDEYWSWNNTGREYSLHGAVKEFLGWNEDSDTDSNCSEESVHRGGEGIPLDVAQFGSPVDENSTGLSLVVEPRPVAREAARCESISPDADEHKASGDNYASTEGSKPADFTADG